MVLRVVVFLEALLHPSILYRLPQNSSSISNFITWVFRDGARLGDLSEYYRFSSLSQITQALNPIYGLINDGSVSLR